MKKLTKAIAAMMLTVAVICAAGCKKDPKIYNVNVSASPSVGGVVTGSGAYEEGQSCTVTATANDGYLFVEWTENGGVVSTNDNYTFDVTGNRTLVAHFDRAYVDLGLPSGTLWATCNIGANAPEDYGDYYAWGETTPKDVYYWDTYQYCTGGSYEHPYYNMFTKYCNNSSYGYNGFTDDLTVLLPEDDAATANWGGDWRMPTKEEWNELIENTTTTWTTQNGVYGELFTASNGASLFLPAAGLRWDGELSHAGSNGYYWLSSLSMDYQCSAWSFCFGIMGYSYRGRGFSVRPVCSARQN